MRLTRLIVTGACCLFLASCLTAYQPVADGGPTAQLKFSSPTYSSSMLSAAGLTVSVYRVDHACNFKHLGWIKFDPKKNGEQHALAAHTIAWLNVSYSRNTLFVGNLQGRMDLVFEPKAGHQYNLEFVTDDKTFDTKVYDETNGARTAIQTADSIFALCRPT